MADDWEQLADSSKVVKPKPNVNKWDGEDIEEDVKDSWEDEDEEEDSKKEGDSEESTPVKTKPKKTLQQKIAEKERARLEELEKKRREKEEADMTPEQRLAEKARIQKLQEENDLKLALETMGLTDTTGAAGGIDARNPQTAEEFTDLAEAISKKVLQFKNRDEFYSNFTEELVRNICASMTSTNIRKIKTTVDNLYLEKQKLEKGDKPKKKGGKVKARLRIEGENSRLDDLSTNYDYDEMDDFM